MQLPNYTTLSTLEQQIEQPSFKTLIKISPNEWEEGNIVITSNPRTAIADKKVIATSHASALSWLFIQLRDHTILPELIEKSEFYENLALAVINYQSNSEKKRFSEADNEDFQGLLRAVIKEAERMFEESRVEIFVYGTLMMGHSNHPLLNSAEFLGEDAMENAQLFNLETHPMLVPGEGEVYGERYRIPVKTVQVLDRLEGHPNYYRRRWIRLKSGRQALVYQGSQEKVKGYPRIPSGRWEERSRREEISVASGTYEFLSYLRRLDVKLFADGEKLRCNAPKGAIAPTLQAEIAARKAEIMAFLQKAMIAAVRDRPSILPVALDKNIPLSFAQERLWFLEQLEPGSSVYNLPAAFRLTGSLDVSILEKSLSEIVRRHEILRTIFLAREDSKNKQPFQLISPEVTLTLAIADLGQLPAEEQDTEAQQIATAEAQQPFDLMQGPLLRVKLLRLGDEEHILLAIAHHIVGDGWSFDIFFRELATLYKAFSLGNPSPLPEVSVQYKDFAVWQRQWLSDEILESQLAYWKQHLSGNIPTLKLQNHRSLVAVPSYRGARQYLALPDRLTAALESLSRSEGVTLFMTLLAAFDTLLYCYTGIEDILVCSPVANRDRPEIEGLIGYFNNILPVRADMTGNPTFLDLLSRVRRVTLGAYEHQNVPFHQLAELPNLARAPLSRLMFALQNTPGQPLELPGITASRMHVHNGTANFDLSLFLEEKAGKLTGWLDYKTDLFDEAIASQMLKDFQTLLENIVANPDRQISQLALLIEYRPEKSDNSANFTPESESIFVAPRDELELKLTQIWAKVLGVATVGVTDNFFELGGHSLLAVRLNAQIVKAIGKNLPLAAILQAPTVAQLAKIIRSDGWVSPCPSLVVIQPGDSKPPLFCIHVLGPGLSYYRPLARHIGSDQPLYGLAFETMEGNQTPFSRVEEIASYYIKEMQTLQPKGPYYLSGISFGGLVIFEMAHRLVEAGEQVALVALIDSFSPTLRRGFSRKDRIIGHWNNLLRFGPIYLVQKGISQVDKVKSRLQKIFYKFYQLLGRPLPESLRYVSIIDTNKQAASFYFPRVYPGKITLFRAKNPNPQTANIGAYLDRTLGWGSLAAGGLEIHEVPGDHFSMLKPPNSQVLAEKMRACIDKAADNF